MYSATVHIGTVPVTVSADSPSALADALEAVGVADGLVARLRAVSKPQRAVRKR